eukprot:7273652-Pyramimonas_sp.AAC.1
MCIRDSFKAEAAVGQMGIAFSGALLVWEARRMAVLQDKQSIGTPPQGGGECRLIALVSSFLRLWAKAGSTILRSWSAHFVCDGPFRCSAQLPG